tara:strand:+ start:347 stop:640 length:294 start_codon:yes stop_codon:yes gene_type:complete
LNAEAGDEELVAESKEYFSLEVCKLTVLPQPSTVAKTNAGADKKSHCKVYERWYEDLNSSIKLVFWSSLRGTYSDASNIWIRGWTFIVRRVNGIYYC